MKYIQQIRLFLGISQYNILSTLKHGMGAVSLLMFVMLFSFSANAQSLEVSGTVVDDNTQEPLPGVTIVVKGTTTGTTSDIDGNFAITVNSADATLMFSFIGYETQEIAVQGQATLAIRLKSETKDIDEVMVIAYGTTKKSNLTGSAVALKNEELKDVFTSNISSMLQGKVAGVYTASESGRPGAGSTITIRGKGSLSGTTAPLWVVDGIIYGNSDPGLSPADVESITVLKDASATSLYGSLAANGVILVQTRRADKGVSKINVNASRGYTVFNTGNFELMNSQELYDYQKTWNPKVTEDVLSTDTDWLKIGTQTGEAQEYNVNYTGGNDKISAYLSGTYYGETGALKGYEYERYSGLANVDIKASEKLLIKANLSGDYRTTYDQQHSTYAMFTYMPWDNPYFPDGSVLDPRTEAGKEYLLDNGKVWYGRDDSNYLYDLQYNYGTSRGNNFRINVGVDYQINDWLTFSSMNNIALAYSQQEYYTDQRSISGLADKGTLYEYYGFSQTRFTNQMLRFKKISTFIR